MTAKLTLIHTAIGIICAVFCIFFTFLAGLNMLYSSKRTLVSPGSLFFRHGFTPAWEILIDRKMSTGNSLISIIFIAGKNEWQFYGNYANCLPSDLHVSLRSEDV